MLLKELNDYEVQGTGCMLRLHIGVGAGEVTGIHIGGTNEKMEFFISGSVLDQVSSCEKQALPGEVYVSAVAWLLAPEGRLNGSQKGKGALANYRLEGIETAPDLPRNESLPVYEVNFFVVTHLGVTHNYLLSMIL